MSDKIEEKLKKWETKLSANSNFRNAKQDFILFNEFTANLLRETEEVLKKNYGMHGGKRDTIGIACLALLESIDGDYLKDG